MRISDVINIPILPLLPLSQLLLMVQCKHLMFPKIKLHGMTAKGNQNGYYNVIEP